MSTEVREHRGTLEESLKTTFAVKDKSNLARLIGKQLNLNIKAENIHISPYGFDERIGWHNHIIMVDGYGIWGFANGQL